jgi:hypothetical protein
MLDSQQVAEYEDALRRIEEIVEMAKLTARDQDRPFKERLDEIDRLHRLLLDRSDKAYAVVCVDEEVAV